MADFKSNSAMIFAIFFGAIIATTFIGPIADSVFSQTNTILNSNVTFTAPAVNATLDITGRAVTAGTTPVVLNATNISSLDLQDLGVSVVSGTGTNGLLTVQISVNDTGSAFAGEDVNVTYTFDPDGFLPDSSSRSITNLIILFSALAVVVFVISRVWESAAIKNIMGKG